MSWEGQHDLDDNWIGHADCFVCYEVPKKFHSFIKDMVDQACGLASHHIDGIYEHRGGADQVWDLVEEKILEELGVEETK